MRTRLAVSGMIALPLAPMLAYGIWILPEHIDRVANACAVGMLGGACCVYLLPVASNYRMFLVPLYLTCATTMLALVGFASVVLSGRGFD